MHSSRMRTARLLSISPSMYYVGGGVCSRGWGGVCLWSGGGSASGLGGSASGPGGVSQHALGQTPPPVNRMTDRQV